jgi:predicted transcriptional regulator
LDKPGIKVDEIIKRLKLSKSTIYYHLLALKKQGFIQAKYDGRSLSYFMNKKIDQSEKKVLDILRKDIFFQIVLYLFQYPDSSQAQIISNIEKDSSIVINSLKELIRNDIVNSKPNGHNKLFYLKNKNYIYDILNKYAECFWI